MVREAADGRVCAWLVSGDVYVSLPGVQTGILVHCMSNIY